MEKDKRGKEKFVEYSLEEAAVKVQISKKSLDDYLLQIRYGKKFGFDFEKNKHEKVGSLRQFVREKKEIHGGFELKNNEVIAKNKDPVEDLDSDIQELIKKAA